MDDSTEVFTPFLRRFGSERERELQETWALYNWVQAVPVDREAIKLEIGRRIYPLYAHLPQELTDAFSFAMFDLLDEPYLADLSPPRFERMNLKEYVDYRNLLYQKQYFIQNRRDIIGYLESVMGLLFERLVNDLPKMADSSPFSIPLLHSIHNPKLLIGNIIGTFSTEELSSRGIFKALGERLYENICAVNGRTEQNNKPFVVPTESKLPLDQIASTYLAGTPLLKLLQFPVPLKLDIKQMYQHVHLLAGSGGGKSVTIEHLIRHFIDQDCSIVLIDPHSELVQKLARADLGRDVMLLDPRDSLKHPISLNPFALNQERMASYDDVTREQVTAGAIETYINLFQNLGIPLTGKQDVFFRACIRMLLSLPTIEGRNATIKDMLNLMLDPTPYGRAIAELPELQRDFFSRDFMSKTFEQTRDQIRYRLQAIISEPIMQQMFCSPETKVDFFSELNRGSIILVDAAKDFLKTEGSANFSKFMVSLILKAILERAATNERKPVLFFIDEAASCFSRDISSMLEEVRKYSAGVILAHQSLGQCTPGLASSIHANTSTKMCTAVSAGDASTMAKELRCDPDFILSQPKLHFATFIRGVTQSAISIQVKIPGPLTGRADYGAFLEANRERVSLPRPEFRNPPNNGPAASSTDIPDISPEW